MAVQELTEFDPIDLQPIPEGAAPLTTTEAEALQTQIDTLTTSLTQTQAALNNSEQINTALIEQAITAGERTTALESSLAYPDEGQEIDTGRTDDGRPVFRRGVGSSMGTANATIIGTDVWKLTAVQAIAHLLGPGGENYQTQIPWVDFDTQARWITVEVDVATGDMALSANMPAGWTIQNWWGWTEYSKR